MGILSIAFPFLQPRVSAPLLPLRPDTEHRRGSKRRRTRLHRCFPRCCTCLSPRRAARGQARRGRDTQGGSREPRIYLILLHSGIQGRVHSTCHTCTHRSRRSSWSSSGSIHGPFWCFVKLEFATRINSSDISLGPNPFVFEIFLRDQLILRAVIEFVRTHVDFGFDAHFLGSNSEWGHLS